MRLPQFKFSVRLLLMVVTISGVCLGFWLRFGPHILWRTIHSGYALGVIATPSIPLEDNLPIEHLVRCNIGAVSFDIPVSMTESVNVHRGIGGIFIQLSDHGRLLALTVARGNDDGLQLEISEFPDKAKLTFPRLMKEILDAQSSDFSFRFSEKELKWHKWLLVQRSICKDLDFSIEYLWSPDLEGILRKSHSTNSVFQWESTNRQWHGDIIFKDSQSGSEKWIRHVCATFVLNANPTDFQHLDEAAIKSMIHFDEVLE